MAKRANIIERIRVTKKFEAIFRAGDNCVEIGCQRVTFDKVLEVADAIKRLTNYQKPKNKAIPYRPKSKSNATIGGKSWPVIVRPYLPQIQFNEMEPADKKEVEEMLANDPVNINLPKHSLIRDWAQIPFYSKA